MGFSASQAQWLIQFMRNLPGGAPREPEVGEYEHAMAMQREQAAQQNFEMAMPSAFEHSYPGYEAPPFGYWGESPPEW